MCLWEKKNFSENLETKQTKTADVVVPAFESSTLGQKQVNLYETEANLVSIVGSRLAGAIGSLCLQNKQINKSLLLSK